ncbi:TVP38/TMEM64 family protein [Melghirimyces algeriensis]|uniref:TVP38/TMEM64 family membrane protein n=1 Tax=Melghirimyces algeriensis TaxID=910412 RepID=A0A521BN12_9BACL|nr:TVP38/TMEM64 family protein [Melghirimyces algeriensis]SMO48534.1 Uncharacterized membrane protein YdjX, TVP38/TMEM64 family, SNARE-associated domain [Melghirimyces algeriensis]
MIQPFMETISATGPWGPVIAFIASLFLNLFGVVPGAVVTGGFVLIWGPIWGGGLAWLGEVIGSGLAFLLLRSGYRFRSGQEAPHWRWISHINTWSRKRQIYAVLAARLIPFIPAGAVNLVGALSTLRFRDYLFATAVGKLPSTALEALVAYDLIHIKENAFRLVIVLLALAIAGWLWKGKERKKQIIPSQSS